MALDAPPAGDIQISRTSSTPARSAGRVDYLDGLRGLACILVVLYHCYLDLHWRLVLPIAGHHIDIANLQYVGYTGVNLFLVLSGICLFLPVVRKDGILNVRDFAIRRCWRIIPPYYAALALVLLYLWAFSRHFNLPLYGAALITHLLFIHNFFYSYVRLIIAPTWTLALEAQWYVAFPLLVVAYRVLPPRLVLASTLFISLAFRALSIPLFHPASHLSVYFSVTGSLPSRIFEFALGMFIAGHLADRNSKGYRLTKWDWLWLVAAALQILWVAYAGLGKRAPETWPFTDAAYGILFASLTVLASRIGGAAYRLFTSKAAIWLGTISYSIYLIHLPVIGLVVRPLLRFATFPHAEFILCWFVVPPICVVSGWLFFLAFERPALNHLQRVRAAQKLKPALDAAEEASDLTAAP